MTSPRSMLMTFRKGWRHGATGRAYDDALRSHPTYGAQYERAYRLGLAAAGAAAGEEMRRLGIDGRTLILRDGAPHTDCDCAACLPPTY